MGQLQRHGSSNDAVICTSGRQLANGSDNHLLPCGSQTAQSYMSSAADAQHMPPPGELADLHTPGTASRPVCM